MERILLVANDFPYPLNHGAVIDMWGHVETLKKLGFAVDLLVTVKAMPPEEHVRAVRKSVDELWLVERERGWKAADAVLPFQVKSRARLRAVTLSREYAAVVLEAEHVASILRNPTLRARKRILRLHNNESRFFREMGRSSRSLFHKLFYKSEALKFKTLSPNIMAECDALWFISSYEMKEHLKRCPKDSAKSFFVPPGVGDKDMRTQPLEGKKALFIGTLGFPNNASGVEWYVSNVHPSLCDVPDYGFVVAGNTARNPISLNRIIAAHPNISVHENPENTESLYRNAAVFVNPVFHGAGLKLKIINAIQAGVPIVTTPNGVQGTGLIHGRHLLVADSAQSFGTCIRSIFRDPHMAKELVASAQEFLAKEYDQARIINASLSAIL